MTVCSAIIGFFSGYILTNVALPLLITFFIFVGLSLNLWRLLIVVSIKNSTYTVAVLAIAYMVSACASFGLRDSFHLSGPNYLKALTFLTPQGTLYEGLLQMKQFTEYPSVVQLNFDNMDYIPSGDNSKVNLIQCFVGFGCFLCIRSQAWGTRYYSIPKSFSAYQ